MKNQRKMLQFFRWKRHLSSSGGPWTCGCCFRQMLRVRASRPQQFGRTCATGWGDDAATSKQWRGFHPILVVAWPADSGVDSATPGRKIRSSRASGKRPGRLRKKHPQFSTAAKCRHSKPKRRHCCRTTDKWQQLCQNKANGPPSGRCAKESNQNQLPKSVKISMDWLDL